MVEELNFRIERGVSERRDTLGNWVSIFDSAQPNPAYKPNPGIHGWIKGESGQLERIDIEPEQAEAPAST